MKKQEAAGVEDDLRRMVRSELGLARLEHGLAQQNRSAWTNFATIASIISLLLWAVVMLNVLGYVSIVPVPSAQSNAPVDVSAADIIGVLVPALLTVVAFFVGATGLKRLQLYDNEFRESRSERRADAEKFQQDVERRFADIAVRVEQSTDEFLKRKMSERTKDIEESIKDIEVSRDRLSAELQEIAKNYEWIFKSDSRDKLEQNAVSSIGELHKVISELFRQGKSKEAKTLIENLFPVGGETDLRGSPDDFFNTATQLASSDLEPLAYRVLREALRFSPNNPDLLATGVKYASDAGEPDDARQLCSRAMELDDQQKNWRIWVFLGTYLQDNASEVEASHYYRQYISRFFDRDGSRKADWPADDPNDRVLATYARYLMSFGRRSEALTVAELAVRHIPRCSQCSAVLSEIHLENGAYAEAIEFAEKAMRDDRRDQRDVNGSSLLLNVALAKDAMLVSNVALPHEDVLTRVSEVFACYAAVVRAKDMHSAYYVCIPAHLNSLVAYLETRGVARDDIVKAMPPELIEMFPLRSSGEGQAAPADEGDADRALQAATLPRIKALSELDDDERDEGLADLARQIDAAGHAARARSLFLQAAQHFQTDDSEADFVRALRRIADMLQRR